MCNDRCRPAQCRFRSGRRPEERIAIARDPPRWICARGHPAHGAVGLRLCRPGPAAESGGPGPGPAGGTSPQSGVCGMLCGSRLPVLPRRGGHPGACRHLARPGRRAQLAAPRRDTSCGGGCSTWPSRGWRPGRHVGGSMSCWRPSTAGSPRALTPPTCGRPRHCWGRFHDVEHTTHARRGFACVTGPWLLISRVRLYFYLPPSTERTEESRHSALSPQHCRLICRASLACMR